MPANQNQTQLYNDLDEVLNKPPKKMVQYGNMLLLLVILMVCGISFTVRHEDIIECHATILPRNTAVVQSPAVATSVVKYFLTKDTLLKQGDTIIVVKPLATEAGSPVCILAPYDCRIAVRRMPEPGEQLQPGTALADAVAAQNKFDVKVEIPAGAAAKIHIGLKVKPAGEGVFSAEQGQPVCTIISTPYYDSSTKTTVADARLQFVNKENKTLPSRFVFKKTVAAAVVCGTKNLASGFFDF